MDKTKELEKDQEYKIRPQDKEERKRLSATEAVPKYRISLDLSQEDEDRLTKGLFKEFEVLKEQRQDRDLEKKWEALDAQYDGEVEANPALLFNLHAHQSKIKENAIVRALNEAFLDSDPLVDILPRPEFAKARDGIEIAKRQTEFLDYAMDEEIKPSHELTLINHSAVRKFVGIGKVCWDYQRVPRKREETYIGENEIIYGPGGQPLGLKNEGLEQFMRAYPDAIETYPGYVEKLISGKTIHIVVDYQDVISNNPRIEHVPVQNFYVDVQTKHNEGLRKAHLTVERLPEMDWWELKEKEANGEFKNVDKLAYKSVEGKDKPEIIEDFENAKYCVIKCNYRFKLKPDDKNEVLIQCWFGEESKVFLGAINWPYYGFDTDYIGFWVRLNEYGFYGDAKSVTSDLRDSNIAQNAMLSLAVHGTYIRNKMTPIVQEGSEIEAAFLEDRFIEGKPISVDTVFEDINKSVGFVQWPNQNLRDHSFLTEQLRRDDSDVTGVSDYASGRESPSDPSAPASKTIALLQASGVNIKDYIRIYLPSFNIFLGNLFQLYYQMSDEEGRKFRIKRKAEGVTGTDIFSSISRDEMIAKTAVQSRASAFAFDKINEKVENMSIYQLIHADPYAAQQPQLLYSSLLTLLRSWGPMWKAIAERDLLGPKEFQQRQLQIAAGVMQQMMQTMAKTKEVTGAPAEAPSNEDVVKSITEAQMADYNPKLIEEAAKK